MFYRRQVYYELTAPGTDSRFLADDYLILQSGEQSKIIKRYGVSKHVSESGDKCQYGETFACGMAFVDDTNRYRMMEIPGGRIQ